MATSADPTVSGRETVSLIGSDKVEGTPVYGRDERKIGMLQRVMIDKISGTVAFAVISFGGFLGIGEDYYPIPWSNLKYDNRVTRECPRKARAFGIMSPNAGHVFHSSCSQGSNNGW